MHYTIYFFNYYCHTESFQLTTVTSITHLPTTGTNVFTGATSELTVTIVVATVTAGCSLVLLSVITCLLFVFRYRLSRRKSKAKYNGDGDIQLGNDNDVVPKSDTPTTELRATCEPVYDNITDVM